MFIAEQFKSLTFAHINDNIDVKLTGSSTFILRAIENVLILHPCTSARWYEACKLVLIAPLHELNMSRQSNRACERSRDFCELSRTLHVLKFPYFTDRYRNAAWQIIWTIFLWCWCGSRGRFVLFPLMTLTPPNHSLNVLTKLYSHSSH